MSTDAMALLALAGLGIGVFLFVASVAGLVAGLGVALIVVSAIVLLYLVLPDRSTPE